MASFVSGSCRYLAWEDAKRSANETNNNAIILEDHHVPCSLSVTSSHKTLAFYAQKSRGLYCAESDFYFLNLEQKSLSFCDTSSKEGKFTVSLKHDLNFANIIPYVPKSLWKKPKLGLARRHIHYCVISPRKTNTGSAIQSSVVKALPHFGPFAILENFLHSYHIIPCMTWISEVGILFKRKKCHIII